MKYAQKKLNENNGTVNVENQEGLENSQNSSDSENETIGNSVADVLKLIKENKLNETETIELCRALGQLSKNLFTKIVNQFKFQSNTHYLQKI